VDGNMTAGHYEMLRYWSLSWQEELSNSFPNHTYRIQSFFELHD
jgi:hypothetical protein